MKTNIKSHGGFATRLGVIILSCMLWQHHSIESLQADGDELGFDYVDQDGWWDPGRYMKGDLDPGMGDPFCIKSDCQVGKHERAAHSLSYDPIGQLPASSGDDDHPADERIEAHYSLVIHDYPRGCSLVIAEVLLEMCTSRNLGNASGLGGPFVGGESYDARADACFDLGEMTGWEAVNGDAERPLAVTQTFNFTLTGDHEITPERGKLSFACYDGAAKWSVKATVTFRGVERKDDDNGGDSTGDDSSAEECEIDPLPLIGRIWPRDVDSNPSDDGESSGGEADGLPDWYEIIAHGIKDQDGKPVEDPEKHTEVRFWDSGSRAFVHPDPTQSKTLNGILDGLQDAEVDYHLWTQNTPNRQQDGLADWEQVEKGDGISAWGEYRGFKTNDEPWTRYIKFNPETTNPDYSEGVYASGLKKIWVHDDLGGDTQGIHIPSLALEQEMPSRLTIHNAFGAGVITLPDPGSSEVGLYQSLYHPFQDADVTIRLEGKEGTYQSSFSELVHDLNHFSGAVNFNNGVHSRDPFVKGNDGQGMIWDPNLQCGVRFRLFSEGSDPGDLKDRLEEHPTGTLIPRPYKLRWQDGETKRYYYVPTVNAVTLVDNLANDVTSLSAPILIYEPANESKVAFYEEHASQGFESEIFYQNISVHEMMQLLGMSPHQKKELAFNDNDDISDIFQEAIEWKFRRRFTQVRYHQPDVSGFQRIPVTDKVVSMWGLYEPIKPLMAVRNQDRLHRQMWFVPFEDQDRRFWLNFFGEPSVKENDSNESGDSDVYDFELIGLVVHEDNIENPSQEQSLTKMNDGDDIWALGLYRSYKTEDRNRIPSYPSSPLYRYGTNVKAKFNQAGFVVDWIHPMLNGEYVTQRQSAYPNIGIKRRNSIEYQVAPD